MALIMKLLVFLASVLCIAAVPCTAQSVSDLVKAVEKADGDSLKVAAYQNLINYYRYSNMDSALLYAHAGLAFARGQHYHKGEAMMTYSIGLVLDRHGVLEQAEIHYRDAKAMFEELGMTKGVAGAANGLGVVAGKTGRYDEATRFFVEALDLYEKISHREGIVQTLIKLGVVNDHLGNLDKALEYYLKAEKLNATLPSSNATLTLLNNIGIIYGRRNDLHTAVKYFQRGVLKNDIERNTGAHILLLESLGLAYQKLGYQDSARHYQQEALNLARQYHLPEEEARALLNLAAMVGANDRNQSLSLLQEALEIAQGLQQLVLVTEVYEAMIGLYKEMGEYKLAMELAEKRQVLKDSLFTVEKSREIANLQATQELARQEDEIRHLALRNEKSVFQRNVMFSVAVAAMLIVVIVWFYTRRISKLNQRLIRKQEALRNSNETKDKLFSILGHDLRAPLHRVIGLLNLLSLERKNEDESGILKKLKQQLQGTMETLDNLLVWGQNQLKGIRLDQQTLNVKERIMKSLMLSSDYAMQKNIQLVDNVSPDVRVYADPSHFDFVIRNLLSNAIKFSHAGGTVSVSASTYPGDEVIFSVADSGVGIPEAAQQKIFVPGNASATGTWNEKGTGIGLMLCKEYIAENGGKLWLESAEGKGSTFYFSLKKAKDKETGTPRPARSFTPADTAIQMEPVNHLSLFRATGQK